MKLGESMTKGEEQAIHMLSDSVGAQSAEECPVPRSYVEELESLGDISCYWCGEGARYHRKDEDIFDSERGAWEFAHEMEERVSQLEGENARLKDALRIGVNWHRCEGKMLPLLVISQAVRNVALGQGHTEATIPDHDKAMSKAEAEAIEAYVANIAERLGDR